MEHMMSRRFALTTVLAAVIAAHVASAQKDIASCKPVLDAAAKAMVTPHHVTGTTVTPGTSGKPRPMELITAGGQNYVMTGGQWTRSRMTPAEMAAQEQENIRTATAYSCHRLRDEAVGGVAAVVYGAHSENESSKSDAQVWVATGSGLILRMETDIDPSDVDHTHISMRYDYTNVHAPAVVP
jgi:hypothetical protein